MLSKCTNCAFFRCSSAVLEKVLQAAGRLVFLRKKRAEEELRKLNCDCDFRLVPDSVRAWYPDKESGGLASKTVFLAERRKACEINRNPEDRDPTTPFFLAAHASLYFRLKKSDFESSKLKEQLNSTNLELQQHRQHEECKIATRELRNTLFQKTQQLLATEIELRQVRELNSAFAQEVQMMQQRIQFMQTQLQSIVDLPAFAMRLLAQNGLPTTGSDSSK
jgi:hypothetical protein